MVMIRNIGHSVAYHFDAIGEIQEVQGGSREGIWWLPNDTATDYLVLTNQGSNPLQIDLSLYEFAGKEVKQKITLAARATSRLSIRQVVSSAGLAGSYGGIKIYTPTHAGSLDSLHILFDEKASFSALLKMFDLSPNTTLDERDFANTKTWTLHAPMLALSNPDPVLAMPMGTVLQPQLFVRNAANKHVAAALRFHWRSDTGSGGAQGPQLQLGPYETRRIDVGALQNSDTLPKDAHWASVTITTNSLPGEVMAIAASYSATLQFGAQTPFSDQLAFAWEGGMWEYDAQHNSLITAGNGGAKPTQAAFTLFYNQGTQRYDLEQTLKPDEQMWIDVGKLIREHIPDKNGSVLPADLSSGAYEFRDLSDPGIGSLYEGKVIYDKTYGHVTYGCADCCANTNPYLGDDPLGIPYLGGAQNGVWATPSCGGNDINVSSYFHSWSTQNTNIATVNSSGYHSGVSVGSTRTTANGNLLMAEPRSCPILPEAPGGGDNTIKLQLQGNGYSSIFVGTDPNLAPANSIFATVSPTGGTFTEASSVSGDTFTAVQSGGPGWVVKTTAQSTSQGDRNLAVSYTVSGQGTVTQSLNVTARQFAYATNNSPGNICTGGYGTKRVYTYTPYTHPDKTAVQAGMGLSNTAVAESFSPSPPAGAQTGNGALDANSQFADTLAYCSNSPLPGSATVTQTLSIEGYQVRQNSLQFSSTGITYTSLGPTQ